ncbi:MAG: glycosyl transferase family 2 [Opitutae bacterium]|nr:glycosyl transferase family 2 [Opitutae bacterium]|tara:strand:+ start:5655 stop:6398 length:744 start_codon:yes stop_codon:yes gene_type:complete
MFSYSVIIPAYNEEVLLADTIAEVRRGMVDLLPLSGEMIVVDNNSVDRTPEIAIASGARVVFEPINQISRARNAGAREAKGKYLFFVDADTIVPRSLLKKSLNFMIEGDVGAGGSTLCFDSKLPVGSSEHFFAKFWNLISRSFRMAAGSFIFCRREAFQSIGGFSEKVFAGEEIFLSMALKRWCRKSGYVFRILNCNPVVTSSRKLFWHSKTRLFSVILLPMVFPFFLRSKRCCSFWYARPDVKGRK